MQAHVQLQSANCLCYHHFSSRKTSHVKQRSSAPGAVQCSASDPLLLRVARGEGDPADHKDTIYKKLLAMSLDLSYGGIDVSSPLVPHRCREDSGMAHAAGRQIHG